MTAVPIQNIRNFAIVAHIDHGKSTLADRLIQLTGGLELREMKEQVLDSMDIERERGITIKAQTVRLNYRARDGKDYILNLIDTPGHVDFAYEVNRSLAACEGSLLVVDASQGVEAQTLANVYQAIDNGHEIVPVLNKVDLPAAEPEKVKQQIEDVIGLDASNAIEISAKTGMNVPEVLEAIVTRLPPPKGDREAPLKALLVDSWYDLYLGVVVLVRVVDGVLKKGQRIRMIGIDAAYEVDRVGVFTPKLTLVDELGPGEIGMLTASIKEVADTRVGDTITDERNPVDEPLPGFRPAIPVVFCGLFPVDAANFEDLRAAMGRLRLNDASFTYEMETSAALGFGFRCGFLGLLHLEIIQERLAREFNLDLIATAPSVIYKMSLRNGKEIELHNPVDMPDPTQILEMQEPWIEATILTPDEYLGSVLKLCQDRRGAQKELTYVGNRALVKYDLPLNEVVFDFYDRLKSVSRGYASFDYHLTDYKPADLVKLSDAGERRSGRRAGHAGASHPRREPRPRHGGEAEGADPAAHVRGADPGRHRRQDHRARDRARLPQGRHRQMLRRRRHAQAQAAGQAEGRQKEDAAVRQGRHSAGGVHRGAEGGCVMAAATAAALQPFAARFKLVVTHRDENQHAQDHDREAEGARHAVPVFRLPHAEPFAADRHEADLPQQEAEREPEDGEGLGAMKRSSAGVQAAQQSDGAHPAQQRGERFGGDDESVSDVMQRWRGDRTIGRIRTRKHRVHRQHVLHERVVGSVVGQIAEGDKGGEQSDRPDHDDFRGANGDHQAAPPWRVTEKPHGFVRQHAAGDRDRGERRLSREFGTRNHNLVHPGGELRNRRGEDQPADVAPQDRAHAHRARFAGRVEGAAAQRTAAVLGDTVADRHHFAVGGRIAVGAAEIAAARQDFAVAHDHRAERKSALRASSSAMRMYFSSSAKTGAAD